jgi:hypothetical protein
MSPFSLLVGGPQHPHEFKTLVLVMIGGITYTEVSMFQQRCRSLGKKGVVVSTTIANRDTMMNHIFKSK